MGALPCATPARSEIVESEVERASLGAAEEEGLGLAATSSHRCGVAQGGAIGVPLSPADNGTQELELGALPRSVVGGIEIVEPAGSEGSRPAAVSGGSAVVDGEICTADGGAEASGEAEGSRERGTPRWRTAPQRTQGPPGGGTEIQAGPEPAEVLPDRVVLQRDE